MGRTDGLASDAAPPKALARSGSAVVTEVLGGGPEEADLGEGDGAPGGSRLSLRRRVRLGLGERIPVWVRSRCGIRPRALAAFTVVLFLAVALAVSHYWTGRPRTVRPPALASTPGAASRSSALSDSVGPGAEPSSVAPRAGQRIVVDVTGEVRDPGIHTLFPGARVADALRAAGGVRPGTDTSGLNRARLLGDGEQLIVGEGPSAGPGDTGGSPPGGPASGPGARVSLNSATPEQLETLPGIGPELAQRIIDYRTAHGGFSVTDELREVNGIGDRRFADLQSVVSP